MDATIFINTRARFQRVLDAKFFAGWVSDISSSELMLKATTDGTPKAGEDYVVQIHGLEVSAIFRAELTLVNGEELYFFIPEGIRLMPPYEDVRLAVRDLAGTMKVGDDSFVVQVLDVSRKGVGLVAPAEVPRGTSVELALHSPHGPVDCEGEVMYCKPEPGTSEFRIGILLKPLGRVQQVRWMRMFRTKAVA
jgi:hypothetical protein